MIVPQVILLERRENNLSASVTFNNHPQNRLTSLMLPTPKMFPTSVRVLIILIRICVPFSITWSPLSVYCGGVALASNLMSDGMNWFEAQSSFTYEGSSVAPYVTGDKDGQGSNIRKEPHLIDRVNDAIDLLVANISAREHSVNLSISDRLALERPHHHRSIVDRKLSHTTSRHDSALGNVMSIHHADDVVLAVACSLDVFQKLVGEILLDARTEEGRMERYHTLEFVEKEHCICSAPGGKVELDRSPRDENLAVTVQALCSGCTVLV